MSTPLILIVEDNARNAKLLRDVLQVKGYRTVDAATAEDGLVAARRDRPDLILMDIQLPGMDGKAALGELRRDHQFPAAIDVAESAVHQHGEAALRSRRQEPH